MPVSALIAKLERFRDGADPYHTESAPGWYQVPLTAEQLRATIAALHIVECIGGRE